ncbi:MAG TPA: PAS domain S-box protein [Bacteroidales bacterium]|nr:PAS domain S-box protein [Bacteroidales bacterium]
MKRDSDKTTGELLGEIRKLRDELQGMKEEQRRFKTLTENLNGLVYQCRNDHQYTMDFISNGVELLTGYTSDDLTGNRNLSWNDLIFEADRVSVWENIQNAIKEHERFKLTYRIIDRNGEQKWVWERGAAVYNQEHQVVALEGFITDITDLVNSEKALEESEQKFRDLYENAPVAYFTVSSTGTISQCNKKASSLLGYSPEELRGKQFAELYAGKPSDDTLAHKMPDISTSDKDLKDYEVLMMRANGSPVWVSMTINTEKDHGNVQEKRILVLNIESRKRAEEALLFAHKRLSMATRSADIGVWDIDIGTGLVTWDERMYEMYGIDAKTLDNSYTNWVKTVHPDDISEAESAYNKAIEECDSFHARFRIILPGGSIRYIQAHGMVQTGHTGKTVRMTGINIDETDRIKNEEHILDLNRLYTVLSNINQSIIRTRDLNELFPAVCDIAVKDGRFDLVWIGIIDPETNDLKVSAFAGKDQNLMNMIRQKVGEGYYRSGPSGKVIETGIPVIIKDINASPEWVHELEYLHESKFNAVASFPLMTGGNVRGVFNLYTTNTGFFGDDELKLLSELSGDISYALEFHDKEREGHLYQERLIEATSALEAVIEASPLAILNLSPGGNVRLWNRAAEKTFGWTSEEVLGKFLPIVQEDKMDEFTKIREHALSGHSYVSTELLRQRKDGSRIFVSLSTAPVYDENGEVNGIIEVLEDITLRKLAEEKLRDSEALYRYLFQNNPHPMIIYDDANLTILEVNDAAVIKYGYSREEFHHLTVADIRPEKSREKFLRLMSQERSPIRHSGTWKHQLKNGTVIDADITSHTLIYEGHNAVLVLVQDVTERKKWEEDLIRAKEDAEQSNRLKDAFVANISHEIRTPLNAILGFSELVRDYLSDNLDDELVKYFDNITKSSHRLMRTVDMILNFSRLQVGAFNIHPHILDLPALVEQLINENRLNADSKSLELLFENKAGDAHIKADEYCILQAVANLLDNAIKYTDKGSIKLTLSRNEHGNLDLAVADTGIGMSEEFFDQLFKPYAQEDIGYTRSYEGIGLGLSMVKQYLELNDATISFYSIRDKGTTFTIHFHQWVPVQEVESKTENHVNIPVEKPGSAKQTKSDVLVVEDDPFSQEYMETILEEKYRVLIAEGAEGALNILSKKTVDLILMDISLKGEMDGLKLTRILKDDPEYKAIPVIALTAHAFAEDRKRSMEAGCDDYFSKPFNHTELLKRMDELLENTF